MDATVKSNFLSIIFVRYNGGVLPLRVFRARTVRLAWNGRKRLAVSVCLALWLAGPGLAGTIDHDDIGLATNAPLAVMQKVGCLRWFYTHASVGGNMITGMNELRLTDTNRYRLAIYNYNGINSDTDYHGGVPTAGSAGGSDYRAASVASTTNGWIYECQRGNPAWANKIVCFSNSVVTSGWHAPKVNVVMDKFCWIDPDANPTNYCETMAALEARCPDTLFVYVTMPLTTETAGSDNDRRNAFNRWVRAYCQTNTKWLLDVADLEAWGTNGLEQTYVSGSVTNQRMAAEYAVGAGGGDYHLNSRGRRPVALGWYALATALFQNDGDADGLSDGDELLAGTRHRDGASRFAISGMRATGGAGRVIEWASISNKFYTVAFSSNLVTDILWTNAIRNIPATPPVNSYTAAVESAGMLFYRLQLQPWGSTESTGPLQVYVAGESVEQWNRFVAAPFDALGNVTSPADNGVNEYGWMVPFADRLKLRKSSLSIEWVGAGVWQGYNGATYSGTYPGATVPSSSAVAGTTIPDWLTYHRDELSNKTYAFDMAIITRGGNDVQYPALSTESAYKTNLRNLIVLVSGGSSSRARPLVIVTGHMPDSGASQSAELQMFVTWTQAVVAEFAADPQRTVRFVDCYTPFLNNTPTTAFPTPAWTLGNGAPDLSKIHRDGWHPKRLASIYAGEVVADGITLSDLQNIQ